MGPAGALVYWRLEFNLGSGVAAIDHEGRLIDVTLDPDYDGNSALDLKQAHKKTVVWWSP
jgi:hypothetical protein